LTRTKHKATSAELETSWNFLSNADSVSNDIILSLQYLHTNNVIKPSLTTPFDVFDHHHQLRYGTSLCFVLGLERTLFVCRTATCSGLKKATLWLPLPPRTESRKKFRVQNACSGLKKPPCGCHSDGCHHCHPELRADKTSFMCRTPAVVS
jgi:hypothetical protein